MYVLQDLEKRLKGRGTETEESLQRRLSVARMEIEYGEGPGNFDKIIVNDDVDRAYKEFKEFIDPEIKAVINPKE